MEELPIALLSKAFLKYDYAESKELCKHFLTTIIAVLVISLIFAGKIVGFGKVIDVSRVSKFCLLGGWASFMLAIITCGIGLACITVAAGRVVYGERSDHEYISSITMGWIGLSGLSFIFGLVSLLIAAGVAVWESSGTS